MQTPRIVIEVRAPSSTSPPSPEGFRPLPLSRRCYKDHRSTQLHNLKYKFSLGSQKTTNFLLQNSLPLQRSLENQWVGMKLLCARRKEKRNQRVLENTSENEREFQHKNQETKSLNALNFWRFLRIFLVTKLSLNTPIYRRGLGLEDKTFLRLIREY